MSLEIPKKSKRNLGESMEKNIHRTWAEIDLNAIEHNFKEISRQVAGTPVLCVIKANAYGHGSVIVAERLQRAGAAYFGVATVPEAIELREHGITLPILILGYVDEADAQMVARYHITVAVYDFDTAEMFAHAAQSVGQDIMVHFKLDTGMTRLGFPAGQIEQTIQQILQISRMKGLKPDGIFTHFAVSDEVNGQAYTAMQQAQFEEICRRLTQNGLDLPVRHCANSGAVLQYQNSYMNMVRAGIILYGFYPDSALNKTIALRPAMTLKAHVVQVRQIEAGVAVSYGRTYETTQKTRLAVLSIGYADGYFRAGSNKAQVMLHGRIVPIVGRICMDMCMAELPEDLEVQRGDEAIIYGAQGVTAETAAAAAGTITYEILCAVSNRVPRIYIQ